MGYGGTNSAAAAAVAASMTKKAFKVGAKAAIQASELANDAYREQKEKQKLKKQLQQQQQQQQSCGNASNKSIISDITDASTSTINGNGRMLRCQVPRGMISGQNLNVRSPYHGGQTITIQIPPEATWTTSSNDENGSNFFEIDVSNVAAGGSADGTAANNSDTKIIVSTTNNEVADGEGNNVVVVEETTTTTTTKRKKIISPASRSNSTNTSAASSTTTTTNNDEEKWGEPFDIFDFQNATFIEPPPNPVIIPLSPSLNPIKVNGRYRALVIGINYLGLPVGELRGCINDAKHIRETLLKAGYPNDTSHMVMLTDDNPDLHYQPTALNIVKAIMWLVNDLKEGDVLFFHFSGHGLQVPDPNGMENDGLNEVILPVDYIEGNFLLDDHLWALLVFQIPSGVRCTALMDCCCSGTMLDLPYQYKPLLSHSSEAGGGSTSSLFSTGGQSSSERSLNRSFMNRTTTEFQNGSWVEQINPCHSRGDVVLFSGCEDGQTSSDIKQSLPMYAGGTVSEGAMTTSFIKALDETSALSSSNDDEGGVPYPTFMATICKHLKQRHMNLLQSSGAMFANMKLEPQRPQLSSSQPFDLSTRTFSLTGGTIIPNHNPIIGRIKRKHIEPASAPSPTTPTTAAAEGTSERSRSIAMIPGTVMNSTNGGMLSTRSILRQSKPLDTTNLLKGGIPYDPTKENKQTSESRRGGFAASFLDTMLSLCSGTTATYGVDDNDKAAASYP